MPMTSKNPGKNIAEFHHGKTFGRMERKFGKAKANKIAVAAGLSAARRMTKKKMGY